MANVANFVGFQLAWFASVLGAAQGHGWIGPLAVALFALAHVNFQRRICGPWRQDLVLAVWLMGVGLVLDTIWTALGFLNFDGGPRLGLVPLWMVGLWANLALTLRHSMRWLSGRLALALVLGAVSGPLSYWAGARLGALELHADLWPSLAVLAASWAFAFPLAVYLEQRSAPRPFPRE